MTEDDIVRMARASGLSSKEMTAEGNSVSMGRMTRFAEMVAAAEREACAQACEAEALGHRSAFGNHCACVIRMRSNV